MTSKRGFASMKTERVIEIARQGGLAVKPHNRSFSTNRELAAAAGRKGGLKVAAEKRSFSKSRDLAVAAGRAGGRSSKNRTAFTPESGKEAAETRHLQDTPHGQETTVESGGHNAVLPAETTEAPVHGDAVDSTE